MNRRLGLDSLARAARRPSGAVATYAEVLRDTYSASEIWPLVDIASGTNIDAFINSARDGTLTGWDLQNAAGPVTGTLAPYSDGANDYGNIYTSNGSTGLVDIFDGDEGSVFMWLRVSGAGVWSDGILREFVRLLSTSQNRLFIFKGTASNQINFIFESGNQQKSVTISVSTTDWFSIAMSWSISDDKVMAFINGLQVGVTQTGLGTWSGQLSPTQSVLLASNLTPIRVWDGYGAYTALRFGSIWSPAQFLGMHNAASTAGPD